MRKYLPILALLIGLGVFITAINTPVFAITIEELQIQIQKLLEAIRSLQSQVPATPPPSNTCPFVSIMYSGYSKTPTNEVRELQNLLKQYPNIYPEGMVTGYFGKLTNAALRRFQQQYSLPTTGQTDTATRAKLCEIWQNQKRIGQCGWCGTACVRQTPNMYCPQVMPPIGVSCQEVNGVCQITPLTPITTTTIPPVPTTIENCAKEGEMFSSVYSQYPKHCCSGLTEWMSGMDSRIVQNGKCVETGLLKGSPIGICIKCGDGICSLNENICNCPQDCAFTTTIPPTTTTIVSCVPEGQSIPVTSLGLQQQCCPGLTLCPPPSGLIGSRGICLTSCNTTTTTIPPTTTTIVSSCTDSDGGNNPYVKGTVIYNGQTSTDFCPIIIPSGIPSTTEVYEFYCENGVMKQVTITCPTGTSCQDGACKPTVATTIPPVATTIPSYGRCSDGSACSWCDNQCTKVTSGANCADVAPPSGATCTCVNNTCTVQYSTTLMNALNKLTASLMLLMELLKR